MKLLIYTHSFAPKLGGVQTLVMSLGRGLAKASAVADDMAVRVTVATPTARLDFDDGALPFRVEREPSLPRLALLIWEADVVHVAGPAFIPMMFALLFRKLLVVEHSGYQAICPNGLLFDERTKKSCIGNFRARRYSECLHCNAASVGPAKSLAMLVLTFPRRWMCRLAARNVAPTDHVSKRIELPRSVTIHHGVPQTPISHSAPVPEFAGSLSFAYVGRFVSEKGLPLLVEAADRLRTLGYNFRLKLIGDGPERAALESAVQARRLNSFVTFTGFLRGLALERELSDVAALVMPSVWEETAGLAAIEHMMRARAVIVSDIGGLAELVDDSGLKFAVGDVAGLVACMKRVIDEPTLVAAFGARARARAISWFSEGRMCAEHRKLYRELASSPDPYIL